MGPSLQVWEIKPISEGKGGLISLSDQHSQVRLYHTISRCFIAIGKEEENEERAASENGSRRFKVTLTEKAAGAAIMKIAKVLKHSIEGTVESGSGATTVLTTGTGAVSFSFDVPPTGKEGDVPPAAAGKQGQLPPGTYYLSQDLPVQGRSDVAPYFRLPLLH